MSVAPQTRTVQNTGTPFYFSDGTLASNVVIRFTLVDATTKKETSAWDAVFLERVAAIYVITVTDAAGEFSVDLWKTDNLDKACLWSCHVDLNFIPDFYFSLASSPNPMTWAEAYASGTPLTPQELSALQIHEASNLHIPTGGSANQVLSKNSSNNYDVAWKTVASGNGTGNGTGDVTGPANAVANNFASFSDTTGKVITDSGSNANSFSPANHVHHGQTIEPNVIALQTDIAVPPTAIGTLFWDIDHQTATLNTSADTAIQIGQETVTRVLNSTVSTILNGKVVYISGAGTGASKDRPTVSLAKADAENTSYMLGVATQDIASGSEGFITVLGTVNGVDCSSYTAGQLLWLSADTAGELTTTKPVAPNHANFVATALNNKNANAGGAIFVHPSLGYELDEIHDIKITSVAANDIVQRNSANTYWENKTLAAAGISASNHTHAIANLSDWPSGLDATELGYVNGVTSSIQPQLDSKQVFHGIQATGTMSFDNTSHVLTLGTGTNTYWFQGTKYTTSSAITCDLDLTADRTGTASTPLQNNTLYYFYFKDATGKLYWSTDAWSLKTNVPVATVFWNGTAGALQNERHNHTRDLDWHINYHLTVGCRYQSGLGLTNMTGTSTAATWTIGSGTLWDEDIQITIDQCTQTSPGARLWYQTGATSITFIDQAYPFLWNGGTSKVQYINSSHTATDLTAAQYTCVWVYGSSDTARPIYFIQVSGSSVYNTAGNARNEAPPNLTIFPFNAELKILWRMVVKGDGTYDVATPPTSSDFRTSSSLPGGSSTTVSAASVTFAASGNIASTNVQGALVELDTEKMANNYKSATFNVSGNLAVGAGNSMRWYPPYSITLYDTYAYVGNVATGANINLSLQANGANVANLTIDANASSASANVANTVTANEYLTVQISQVGSTLPGANMTLRVRYT